MKNIKSKSATALAVGMSVILGSGNMVLAADNRISKEENVYINAEADGTVKEITVSEWLKNSGETSGETSGSSIKDVSDLTEIKNTKGDEEYTQKGQELTWENDGKDIYYEGKTEKGLPVTVKFTYELDGKEIKPNDLAGKSGHLKIHVTYQNNKKVNGKSAELYSPFMMITGMILSTDHFSNVTVDNGKVVEDDSRNIVLGIAMPGLKESLDLSKDVEDDITIPEDFTMEAEVTECEMTSSFTVAMPDVLDEIDLDDLASVEIP